MKLYIVNAFTDRPFSGNPAAVCILDAWPDADWMRKMASENNLSNTAFLVRNGSEWYLRWFTPLMEVGLCGHAPLASAFVVMKCLDEKRESFNFETGEGRLPVKRSSDLYNIDFPLVVQEEIPVTPMMGMHLGSSL